MNSPKSNMIGKGAAQTVSTAEAPSVFSRYTKKTMSWFKNDKVARWGYKTFIKPKPFDVTFNKTRKAVGRYIARAPLRRVGRVGMTGLLAVGAAAMVGVGLMKGVLNASTKIVAERQMQDQRYARNITMMSRLGYTSGTSSMNRYNHTVGLSQSLSANRHGRGGY